MGITDWNEYMKAHHIKIYTEEELRKKKLKQLICKAKRHYQQHKGEILKGMDLLMNHASET